MRQIPVPNADIIKTPRTDATTFLSDPHFGTVVSLQSTYGYLETPDVRRSLEEAKALKKIKAAAFDDDARGFVPEGPESVV